MAFRRRKKGEERDPFAHLSADREEAESGTPWFLGADGGPDLDVEAGISSNLRDDDLERRYEAERRSRWDDAYDEERF